jgi:DNA-binding IclR family transcriptional regulator
MADSPVLKALAIIKCLATCGAPTGVQQLASNAGLNTSTVHRLLQLLVREGFVSYDAGARTYAIGSEGIRFATQIVGSSSLLGRVRPHIAKLAAELGETCAFTLYEPKSASKVVALVERGTHALGYDFDVGSRDGVHAGASGKPILAFLPDAEIERILRRKLPKLTEFTVVDPAELRKQIQQIRKQGYAVSHGERIPGAGIGVGAPVFDSGGRAVGSVVATIPAFRWRRSRLKHVAQQVMSTAHCVSQLYDPGLATAIDADG